MKAPFTPTVSVIVLNRERPKLLHRVLAGMRQVDYPHFEVIVVGDRANVRELGLPMPLARDIRYFHCGEANISQARNIGIRAAHGEIVAFCDDDAVPEPDWLSELVLPFAAPEVAAVGGLVRSDDGIGVQWRGSLFDRTGAERPLIGTQKGTRIFPPPEDGIEFAGLMGVNTAFRRRVLQQLGGFDESFHYYLDETDVALRIAEAGWSIAYAPAAEVHHFHATNASRGPLRRPRSFHQIGASKAYFCKRHTPRRWIEETILTFHVQKRAEMDPFIRNGMLGARACGQLEQDLIDGFIDGLDRLPVLPLSAGDPQFGRLTDFASRLPGQAINIALVAGWGIRHGRRMRRLAHRLTEAGARVSLFHFRTGNHRRSVRFEDGVWLHTGGTWRLDHWSRGRRLIARGARAEAEIDRVAARRDFDLVLFQRGLRIGYEERALFQVPGLPAPLAAWGTNLRGEDLDTLLTRLSRAIARDTVGHNAARHADSLDANGENVDGTRH